MSRFDKNVVHYKWRHERIALDDPKHPFPGIMVAYGMEDGREVAVYVSDYITKKDPIPNIMGKYLLDKGLDIIDLDGFHCGFNHYYTTKDEFFHLLGDCAKVFEMQGIKLLIILIGKLLKDKAEYLKGKTKKEYVHDIIDNLTNKVDKETLTFDNVSMLLDGMIKF